MSVKVRPVEETVRSAKNRGAVIWWLGMAALAIVWLQPIRTGMLRLILAGGVTLLWSGAFIVFRHRRWVVVGASLVGTVAAWAMLWPGRPADIGALRAAYVRELRSYAGVRYVWGGETRAGIDCSGLIRCALMNAEADEGWRTGNPALLRSALRLWWRDASARALKDGYGGQADPLLETRSLNTVKPSSLEPGDFAVAESGIHTLAYLGGSQWIAADGDRHQVMKFATPAPDEPWFRTGMTLLRWKQLATPG